MEVGSTERFDDHMMNNIINMILDIINHLINSCPFILYPHLNIGVPNWLTY